MYKIAIFASGSGTNAENIVKHFATGESARVALVLTNVRDAGVVGRMQRLGVDTYYVPNAEWRERPESIASFLKKENIDLVVLAGFMRKVDDAIVHSYKGRMLNIHPSLLPAYGGKGMYGHHVHEAVIAAGENRSGVTVHQVSEVMDGGDIVAQRSIDILPEDNAASLEAKIHEIEYELYPEAIEKVLQGFDKSEEAPAEEPTVARQWADALGMEYDEASASAQMRQTPPPVPEMHHAPAPDAINMRPEAAPVRTPHFESEEPAAMPSTYLLWSVLCIIFCCTIAGIVATIFSCQVSSRYYNDNYEGAQRSSRRAQIWIIISFCIGILQATVFGPLYLLMF